MVKTRKADVLPKTTANKCTCCNSVLKKNKSHHIFDEYGKFRRIQFLLAECVQKTVLEVSGTVQAICSDCLNQLEQNYAFKLKCISSRANDNEVDEDVDDEEEDDEEDDDEDDEMQLEVKIEAGNDGFEEVDTLVKVKNEFVLEKIDDVEDAVPDEIDQVAAESTETQDHQNQLELIHNENIDNETATHFQQNDDVEHIDDDVDHIDDAVDHIDDAVDHIDDEVEHIDDDVEHIDDDVEHIDDDVEHIDDDVEHIDDDVGHDSEHIKFETDMEMIVSDENSTPNDEILVYVAMETDKLASDQIDPLDSSAIQEADERIIQEFTVQEDTEGVFPGLDDQHADCVQPGLADSASAPDEILFDPVKTFVECLTVHSIKEKIRVGIPVHAVLCRSDRESDDADENDDADQNSERRDRSAAAASMLQLKEEVPIDVDEYVMSIVSVSFCEYSQFQECVMCNLCEPAVPLDNYTAVMQHTVVNHSIQDDGTNSFACCLNGCGIVCADLDELQNHQFVNHSSTIGACCFLICQTCDLVTESLAKFGKHVCTSPSKTATIFAGIVGSEQPSSNNTTPSAAANANAYPCNICHQQLRSHRRHTFHQQFHVENARPKLCLVCDRLFADEHRFYEHVQFAHEQFAQHFCRYCDRSFTLPGELRRHEHAHTAVRSLRCDDCDKTFFDQASLTTHRSLHEAGFTCDHCGKLFNRKFRLRKHMALHVQHEPAVLPMCELCGRLFATEQAAHQHWSDEHAGSGDGGDGGHRATDADAAGLPLLSNVRVEHAFCCEYCEAAFERVAPLLEHKAAHDAEDDGVPDALRFRCAHCPRRFTQYARLRSHANAHLATKRPYPVKRMFVCELNDCRKPYADWNNFQTHRKTVHLINPSIIRCQLCDEVFYKSWLYAYHKKSVHQAHKQCPLCPLTFVLQRALDEHVGRAHVDRQEPAKPKAGAANAVVDDDDDERTDAMQVDVQDEEVVQRRARAALLVMEDVHYTALGTSEGFKCLECGKIAMRRSNAVSHVQMVHMKVRNFGCGQCDRTFYHRGDLNDHVKMHNSVTPFKCPYCEYKVRTNSMLKLHIRSHTNERPYQCTQCSKAFKRQLVLTNHMKLHAGVKAFACKNCDMTFYTKYSLNNHDKKKHGEFSAQPTSGTQAKPARIKKSTIIVMPGPPDRQNSKILAAAAGSAKSILPTIDDHNST